MKRGWVNGIAHPGSDGTFLRRQSLGEAEGSIPLSATHVHNQRLDRGGRDEFRDSER
jgi:hypothetical protein